jgi:hypothetical protein
MKIVAVLLSALLYACAAQAHQTRIVAGYTPHTNVRAVHHVVQPRVRIVTAPIPHTRLAVVYPLPRQIHRPATVLTYTPHNRPAPLIYGQIIHRHHSHCRH